MFKTIAIIVSSLLFTILGVVAGVVIVLNRPADVRDHEGFITILMVLLPTGGGLIAGMVVGVLAAMMGGPPARSG